MKKKLVDMSKMVTVQVVRGSYCNFCELPVEASMAPRPWNVSPPAYVTNGNGNMSPYPSQQWICRNCCLEGARLMKPYKQIPGQA